MFDNKGRVWITATVRPSDNPDFCKEGSDHPSAKLFPLSRASRHLGFYDPKTKKYTHISTCFSTHHLMFAEDENNTLWTSGGGDVIGWLNTKKYEETGDEKASQGWTALILDTNGNGKRDNYAEPDELLDPARDKRIAKGLYAVSPAPDGSVWGSSLGYPGAVIRLDPGSNPPETYHWINRVNQWKDSRLAVWMLTGTALHGWHSPADTSPASTEESARGRLTDQMLPANIVPKAGRSMPSPCPSFRV